MRMCGKPGCNRVHRAQGFCDLHYRHARRAGLQCIKRSQPKLCSMPGCGIRSKARGLCGRHYARWYRADRGPEQVNAQRRAWYLRHAERERGRAKAWRALNQAWMKAYAKQYAESGRRKQVDAAFRERNRTKINARNRGEKRRAKVAEWVLRNRERVKAVKLASQRRAADALRDSYVRKLLGPHVPPALIEAKRAQLQLQRLISKRKKT